MISCRQGRQHTGGGDRRKNGRSLMDGHASIIYNRIMLGLDLQKLVRQHRFSQEFIDLGLIGSGGFSEVHRVRQKIDGREYALKMIRVKTTKNGEETEQRLYRTLNEARLHSQLQHPNILQYHGCWIEIVPFNNEQLEQQSEEEEEEFEMVLDDDSMDSDGICFGSVSSHQSSKPAEKNWKPTTKFVLDPKSLTGYKEMLVFVLTQLCEVDLQQYLYRRNQRGLSGSEFWQENCRIGLQMAAGLRHLHGKKVLHRDIKLQNVVMQDGRCKLIDFGIARKTKNCHSLIERPCEVKEDGESEWLSKSVGTPLFSSPEQSNSHLYDCRTDIFSLAMVILLLFSSFTTAHQQRDLIQSIRMRQFGCISMPSGLKAMLYRCLGQENERPSLIELQTALRQALKKQIPQSYRTLPLAQLNPNTASLIQHKFVDLSVR